MNDAEQKVYPKVGIGVMILNPKNNKILLGLRKGSHGEGEWAYPGGHLEFGETVFETAKREVKEETGLDIEKFELISVVDEMRYIKTHNKHYLNIGVLAFYEQGTPEVMEKEFCEKWEWFDSNNLPDRIFEASEKTIENFKNKKVYKDNVRTSESNGGKVGLSEKAIIVNENGKFLTIKRTITAPSRPLAWDFPGGDLEFGEDPIQGIIREIKEETGIDVGPQDLKIFDIFSKINKKGEFWSTVCYIARVKDAGVVLSDEHSEYKWVSPEEFLKLESGDKYKKFATKFMNEYGESRN